MSVAMPGLPPMPPDWPAAGEPLQIPLDAQRWLSLEQSEEGARLLVLFVLCPWGWEEAAERALLAVNLRERAGPAVVVGVYRDALVWATRLDMSMPPALALEAGAGVLLQLSEQCLRA